MTSQQFINNLLNQ